MACVNIFLVFLTTASSFVNVACLDCLGKTCIRPDLLLLLLVLLLLCVGVSPCVSLMIPRRTRTDPASPSILPPTVGRKPNASYICRYAHPSIKDTHGFR